MRQPIENMMNDIETERFIALIQKEPFDYTKWRQGPDEDLSIEQISRQAMISIASRVGHASPE